MHVQVPQVNNNLDEQAHQKRKRGRKKESTAITLANKPHTSGETQKAHDQWADSALQLRYDLWVGDQPRGRIAGLEALNSATGRAW